MSDRRTAVGRQMLPNKALQPTKKTAFCMRKMRATFLCR